MVVGVQGIGRGLHECAYSFCDVCRGVSSSGLTISRPSRRAGGKVTAWLYFRRRGRAPWPGPHRDPAGRAAGPPAMGARAGPSAGGYGSAALFLISLASHPMPGADGGQPGPVGPALRGTVRIPAAVARHPKVAAGWNVAVRRSAIRRCYTTRTRAMRWFDRPVASSRSTSSSRSVSGSARPGGAAAARIRCGTAPVGPQARRSAAR